MSSLQKQPWLESKRMDLLFILLPALLPLLLILVFQDYFSRHLEVTSFWWILLVLNIDVAHVYSTLFRFYWDKEAYTKYKSLLWIIPSVSLVIGIVLHVLGPMVFWRVIAYLAVFHFIRQQYGFMRLYSRHEIYSKPKMRIDSFAIYNATMYPILFWHFNLTDDLHWFVKGDFVALNNVSSIFLDYLYWSIIAVYVAKEIIATVRDHYFNVPKNLLIAGTYLSWYFGIVTFKGDLVFTMLNVVAHGIPYMALVYFFSQKKSNVARRVSWKGISIFFFTVVLLAYLEEGLWDGFVWRDHENIFPFFSSLPSVNNPWILSFLVPLLALPQITHYVLDGFIWKLQGSKSRVVT